MTGWDVTPSGVESILSLVGLAADDLSKDVKGYGLSVQDAALSAGTISGPYCGTAPVGPVGAVVATFAAAVVLAGGIGLAGGGIADGMV